MTEQQQLYTITGMQPEYIQGSGGRAEQAYRVDFRTATGQHSHVFVARSETLDQDIHEAVQKEAEQIVATMNRPGVPLYTPPA